MRKPKNIKAIIVGQSLLLMTVCVACEDGSHSNETSAVPSVDAANTALPTYDDTRSKLVLPGAKLMDRQQMHLDTHALQRRLMQLNDETDSALAEGSDAQGHSETEFYAMNLDAENGDIDVSLKEESHTRTRRGNRNLQNDEIRSLAEGYFESLGIDASEAGVTVKSLMSAKKAMDGTDIESIEEKGKFVFINRMIDNVPVAGNRIVMYYKSDGLLQGIHGRWTPIDYSHSTLSSRKSRSEILNTAKRKLAEAGVSSKGTEFTVNTFYLPEKNADGTHVLRLKSTASAFEHAEQDPIMSVDLDL